ncbi:MAG: TetR/AcrR family transcriptional regulator [Erysipelotrichaceae bacterium]|nr:TetR/AcrR family transcriptional regulator [Erysipelotrichaceae bacterium]
MNKRELIMDEAFKLFFEKGYYGLGLQELLKRCGIPKGSFYHYFPDGKNQLLCEVVERTYELMKEGIVERILVKDNAVDSFVNMVDYHASTIEGRKYLASLMMTMVSIESLHLNEKAHQVCQNVYHKWQNLYFDKLVEYGYDQKEARQKAQALFALIHGSLISSFIKQSNEDLLLIREEIKNILN